MAFVQLSNISVAFGARDLIKSATLTLMEGSRAALAGPNGAGKSTLMKIAVGQFKADTGDIAITKGARISYLPQTNVVLGRGTVLEEAETAFVHIAEMIARQEDLGRRLQAKDIDERQTGRLLEEFDEIGRAVESSGYFRRAERIAEVLRGLGFSDRDFLKKIGELSGGWQMRLALAKILLEDPDIMLLDEPTNYLDLEARTWLENFLRDYRGGVLLVSHDRYFLDVTITEVYELFNGKLSRYPGTYSGYENRRSKELEAIFESWERQQEEIQKIEDFVRRFRYKESKAAQVQSRIKMLDKIIPIEIPEGMKQHPFQVSAGAAFGQDFGEDRKPLQIVRRTQRYRQAFARDRTRPQNRLRRPEWRGQIHPHAPHRRRRPEFRRLNYPGLRHRDRLFRPGFGREDVFGADGGGGGGNRLPQRTESQTQKYARRLSVQGR